MWSQTECLETVAAGRAAVELWNQVASQKGSVPDTAAVVAVQEVCSNLLLPRLAEARAAVAALLVQQLLHLSVCTQPRCCQVLCSKDTSHVHACFSHWQCGL